ncbi:insulinase family protein [Streptomyces sp. WAC07149]|uniref:M16 family metallopeptidase n=1 Tax=Streptomyces sp. WAC07149 TaxID=2487425 RepID=UPI000F7B9EFA|nr:pitrilysin family protein [Streptomyces sp. WAC07149]RST00478.1 insulinase family protein [Streptomyces sp. WAC07149]
MTRPLPPLHPEKPLALPRVVERHLPSGLRILAVPRKGAPLVEVRVLVPLSAGDPLRSAAAELLTTTAFSGSVRLDGRDVPWDSAFTTGRPQAQRMAEWLTVVAHVPAAGLDRMLAMTASWLAAPAVPEDRLARERERLSQALAILDAQPQRVVLRELNRARYGDLPVFGAWPPAATVAALTADDVLDTHRTCLSLGEARVIVVGDIDAGTTADTVARAFDGLPAGAAAPVRPAPAPAGRMRLVPRPGAAQSHVALSGRSVPFDDPRYPALAVANAVFAGYFSSRLVANIRERRGLAYHALSRFDRTLGTPSTVTDVVCGTPSTGLVVSEVLAELTGLVESPPSPREIDGARTYLRGSLLTATASQSDLADLLASLCCWDVGTDWIQEYPRQLLEVTADQVAAACRDFFGPGPQAGVVLGDPAAAGPSLTRFGFEAAGEQT